MFCSTVSFLKQMAPSKVADSQPGPGARFVDDRVSLETTSPSSGFTSPTIMLNVVVLPAPFGPNKPTISPGDTEIETPLTTRFLNCLAKPLASNKLMAGASWY